MTGSFPSPESITRAVLPNGVIVLTYETHGSPSVVMSGHLWAGSLSEPPAQAGLANLTAGSLTHGTETRTFGQINEALESVGAQLGFGSATHTVGFGGKALAEDLDLLLDILADCLRKPTFPDREVAKLRGQILTDLERRAHDTRRMARLTFNELLYPDHPYGYSVNGYPETVQGLDRQDLVRYYADHYSPQGLVISVVGAVPAQTVVDKVAAALGDWEAPAAQPNRSIPPAVELDAQRRRIVAVEGKTQADVIVGWPALARNDPDFMKAYLANTVLGVFGMMGRLGDNIREEQGLAYYVYSRLEAGLGVGPWLAVAGVNPANVERAIDGILHEARRLRDELVPGEELADSQAYLTGSMPLRLETNEGISATLVEIERHGLGLDYLQRYEGLVRSVTAQDIREVSLAYLDPEVYVLAVAGPPVQESR
ncbi:MAG: insulinase family protein [Anaerolineae bacterium]|nr:insulinase family protein [Anaerolineae bacterium]